MLETFLLFSILSEDLSAGNDEQHSHVDLRFTVYGNGNGNGNIHRPLSITLKSFLYYTIIIISKTNNLFIGDWHAKND